eukprot:tig00020614_g12175.t1
MAAFACGVPVAPATAARFVAQPESLCSKRTQLAGRRSRFVQGDASFFAATRSFAVDAAEQNASSPAIVEASADSGSLLDNIPFRALKPHDAPPAPAPDFDKITFSLSETDYMYTARGEWLVTGSSNDADVRWEAGQYDRFGDIQISPAAAFMSYGLGIFEGLKAQRSEDGRVLLFRPEMNARRFRRSAERLLMAQFPEQQFVDACHELVRKNIRFVPPADKGSFYIRPTQHAIEPILGLSANNLFLVLMYGAPVGSYFSGKRASANVDKGLRLRCLKQGRVPAGGTGSAKCMGNYAGGIYIATKWKKEGYDDVLYLESSHQKYCTETSGSNFFCLLKNGTLVTPTPDDQVLPGVTRDSVIRVARDILGLKVEERALSIDEVVADGVEVFCTGTAWTVRQVGEIDYEDAAGNLKTATFYPKESVTAQILARLRGIQTGAEEDRFGWIQEVKL